jgi:hypothetical protein
MSNISVLISGYAILAIIAGTVFWSKAGEMIADVLLHRIKICYVSKVSKLSCMF